MNPIAEVILAAGFSGLIVALVLFVFLIPAMRGLIEHSYQKVLESVRTDHVLVQKRFEIASQAIHEMALLHEQLLDELEQLEAGDGDISLGIILKQIHPKYRRKFRILRSKLETTNDLLSYYSLSFDSLLHPNAFKALLADCEKIRSFSDHKYAYRSIWLVVIESLHSLLRVSSSHEFWRPEATYANRARAWAEHERILLIKHFVARFNGRLDNGAYYALEIEREGGVKRFWQELPVEDTH
tara:strand:- start:400 stop:1122 length:723 start_codon:yes stop_codon:yes gene_type:complete